MASSYVLQKTDDSFCPDCNQNVSLLCPKDADGPKFYICFHCGFVGQVGEGRVPEGGKDEPS